MLRKTLLGSVTRSLGCFFFGGFWFVCFFFFNKKICAQELGLALGLVVAFIRSEGHGRLREAVKGVTAIGRPARRSGRAPEGRALEAAARIARRGDGPSPPYLRRLVSFPWVFLTRSRLLEPGRGWQIWGLPLPLFHGLVGAAQRAGFDLCPCFNSECHPGCRFHLTAAFPGLRLWGFFPHFLAQGRRRYFDFVSTFKTWVSAFFVYRNKYK